MFDRILIALEAAVLALWAGAMAGFAFIFAPIAIRYVPHLDVFGTLVGAVIRRLGTFGAICGAIAIVAAALRARVPGARPLALARIALVCAGVGASAYENRAIVPAMEVAAARVPGPLDSVPTDDPRRLAYGALHKASTRVYGTAFLCVLAAVALVAFGRGARDPSA